MSIQSSTSSDLVLLRGRVFAFDENKTVVQALAVDDGRISFVGDSAAVKRLIGRKTTVIDLGGRTATPGLIDSHSHLAMWGLNATRFVDVSYPKVDNIEKLKDVVRKYAESNPKSRWILGRGWHHAFYPGGKLPGRDALDEAVDNRPVVLWHVSDHMMAVNSLALEVAKIGVDTPDPIGGAIDREESTGRPTGVLREKSAMDLVMNKMPRFKKNDWMAAIQTGFKECAKLGITSVKDANTEWASKEIIGSYRALRKSGKQTLRVCCLYRVNNLKDLEDAKSEIDSINDDWLKIPGVKLLIDGAVTSRTAWLSVSYKAERGNAGFPTLPISSFRKIVRRAHLNGWEVCVHALGDRAIEETITAFEQAQKALPRSDPRHSIIHCLLPRPEHLKKIKANNLLAEIQSPFIYFLGDAYLQNLKSNSCRRILPLKTMMSMGITVGNGSDSPVTPFAPAYGIYGAVARKTVTGKSIPKITEALTRYEAFSTYTRQSARCLSMEDVVGTLEVGKYADIVVWSRDPFRVRESEIPELRPDYTIINGKIVYRRGENP